MPLPYLWPLLVLVLASGVSGYGYYLLSKAHQTELTALTQAHQEEVSQLSSLLSEKTDESNDLAEALAAEKARTGSFERTISGIKETVDTLEKLKNTDPELLKKYSKVYFLNENYVPSSLTRIPAEYAYPPERELEIHGQVAPFLEKLLSAAKKDGVDLRVASAYRSFGSQSALKSSYTVSYGYGANRFSADQGYSEHQLGTTVDFTTSTLGGSFNAFAQTEAYAWLTKNAHRYGFVLSYPKENTYYQYEPWHWRFVGRELAGDLEKAGAYLYSLSERDIDAYLVSLFD